MFIKRVSLSEFGRLTGTIEFERNRCNIICQDNEYGKTTIMDAVLYALYNFPTSGFSRDTMKPKDRYRPWNAPARSPNVFVVELEIHDINERNYLLRADFTRNQPFTLHDADTKQPIALDGMSFGQRYLRMPLSSFTQAFFLRQDEKEGQKGQLVNVIEEAAASNRRDTPSSVRQALESLGAPRMIVPVISSEPLLVKNLVKRLEELRNDLQARRDELQRRLDAHAKDISASSKLDGEIATRGDDILNLEYALVSARSREKQTLLNRYQESREAQAERERTLAELEPFAAFNPEKRGEVMAVLGDWKLAKQRHEEARRDFEGNTQSELTALEAQLAEVPETAGSLGASDLDALRSARTVVADRSSQLARETEKLSQLEAEMIQHGVPVERLNELHAADSALSLTDREIIFEHDEARAEAQAALTELEQSALTFRQQSLQAKNRRSWFGNLGLGITGLVIGLMAVGIVLLLTDNRFFGWALLIIGAVAGIFSSLYIGGMRSKIAAQELEPALQGEMALAGQTRQIKDQLETLDAEYEAVLQRLGLTDEQVKELHAVEHWKQAAAPWVSAREHRDRLIAELNESRAQTAGILSQIMPGVNTDEIDEEVVATAINRLEQFLEARKNRDSIRERADRSSSQLESLAADFAAKDEALKGLVAGPETEEIVELEEKAQTYLNGCEKALRLQTLKQEYGAVQGMTEAEAEELEADLAELARQQQALGEQLPDNGETMEMPSRPEELERRLADARAERDQLKDRRNRGFRDAEQVVSEWRTKGPEIERALAEIDEQIQRATDFEQACQLAHTELKAISEQVYTQWATALNDRVNRIMPLVNDRYKEVALSPDLDISVFSREAGRRLESKEIQHLSKGARDQLLLAMRIAIAEYLSAHVGNLPLALDEPFAHWDDQRFMEGMRFLSRLAAEKHQVILLSCHSWRYNHLREQDPDLYHSINFAQVQAAQS